VIAGEKKARAAKVLLQLGAVANIHEDNFIFHAGSTHINPLRGSLTHISEPLEGINLFGRVSWLQKKLEVSGRPVSAARGVPAPRGGTGKEPRCPAGVAFV